MDRILAPRSRAVLGIVWRYTLFVAIVLRRELWAAVTGGQPLELNSTVVFALLAGLVFVAVYELIARLFARRKGAAHGASGA